MALWSAWARARVRTRRRPGNRSWDRSGASDEATHRKPHSAGVVPIEARPPSCESAWFRMVNGACRVRTRGMRFGDDGVADVYTVYPRASLRRVRSGGVVATALGLLVLDVAYDEHLAAGAHGVLHLLELGARFH